MLLFQCAPWRLFHSSRCTMYILAAKVAEVIDQFDIRSKSKSKCMHPQIFRSSLLAVKNPEKNRKSMFCASTIRNMIQISPRSYQFFLDPYRLSIDPVSSKSDFNFVSYPSDTTEEAQSWVWVILKKNPNSSRPTEAYTWPNPTRHRYAAW